MYRRNFLGSIVSFHRLTNFAHTTLHKRALRFPSKSVQNPGVEKRLEALDYSDKEDVSQEELEKLDHSELDFMNMHLSDRQLEREMKKMQDTIRTKILQKKYFKQKLEPALLTWEEKEQICQLHKLNPEKWNVHTLSESFPASKSVIEKILRVKWKSANVERIHKYNKSVEKNWKLLYEGKLEISEETRIHLARFSSRKKVILASADSDSSKVSESIIAPTSREFSDIVQPTKTQELITDPFQKLRQSFTQNSLENAPDETYVLDDNEKKSHTLITLDMYRKKVLRSGKPLDPVDKAMIDNYKSNFVKQDSQGDSKKPITSNNASIAQFDESPNEQKKQQNKIYGHIDIPCHLKGKGTLYKLDDCYYDEDGELLYRVPGMV